jgi:hypothetical protein
VPSSLAITTQLLPFASCSAIFFFASISRRSSGTALQVSVTAWSASQAQLHCARTPLCYNLSAPVPFRFAGEIRQDGQLPIGCSFLAHAGRLPVGGRTEVLCLHLLLPTSY